MLKILQQMHFRNRVNRAIRNPAEATSDLMRNKMLIELQSFKKCSPKLFRDSYK